MLGFPTWVILAVECFFHRKRNQEAKQGELNYTISWCQRHSYNLSFFRLIAFCREKSSHVTVVSTNSFMCFVHIAGNRAAFLTVSYHQVQRHSWSPASPLLEAQDPLRAIFYFFWLRKSQLLLAPNLGFYHGVGTTQHCQKDLGQASFKVMSHVVTKATFAFSRE